MAGCSYARLGSQVNTVSAAWGGIEGIGTELVEIQKQIGYLDDPNDPGQVAAYLKLKRESMLLEFETAVRYPIRDQFVVAKNTRAYQVRVTGLVIALGIKCQYISFKSGTYFRRFGFHLKFICRT